MGMAKNYTIKSNNNILNKEKLFYNINFVENFNNYQETTYKNIGLFINYSEQNNEKSNEKIELWKSIINTLSPNAIINIYFFNDLDSFRKELLKAKKQKNSVLIHAYKQIDKNLEKNKESLFELENFALGTRTINFFPALQDREYIFDEIYNSILVGSIGEREKKQKINRNIINPNLLYLNKNNKFKRTSPNIVVQIPWTTNTETGIIEDNILATVILAASTSNILISTKIKEELSKNKEEIVINSILNSARKNKNYFENSFNNNFIYIGAGVFDYSLAKDTLEKGNNFIIKSNKNKKEHIFKIDLKKDEKLLTHLFWKENLFEISSKKILNLILKALKIQFLSLNPFNLISIYNLTDDLTKELVILEEIADFDLEIEYLDGDWQIIEKSNSKMLNFEKIEFIAPFTGQYRIIIKNIKEKERNLSLSYIKK